MKIDRHNYEEFFLLYVDNELSAEQKKFVDQFVRENADLAKELEILQQLTLKADDNIVFEGKELLLKKENDSFITMMNYEEYLVSYIDNELNYNERKEFEKFAASHPQVKEELEVFQQTKLQPKEEIVFEGKELLFKKENDSFITMMNYEEYLVAYIDDELNAEERTAFEKFAALHPQVKEELGIFQQTKLQPEEIVFANKEILYRREEKVRVITMQWWKIAVAAAVILAIGITTITVLNKPTAVSPGVATNNKKNTEKNNTATKTEQEVKKAQQTNPAEIKNNSDAVASTKSNDKKSLTPVQNVNEEKIQKKIIKSVVNKDNNESIAKKDLPVKKNNAIIDNKTDETKIIESIKKLDDPVKTNDVAVNTNLPKQNINNDPVTKNSEVPYNIQTDAIDKESPVTAASYDDEGKNKKLRGFFRKAARVFERRTNISSSEEDNSDKVLIGAVAVKLK